MNTFVIDYKVKFLDAARVADVESYNFLKEDLGRDTGRIAQAGNSQGRDDNCGCPLNLCCFKGILNCLTKNLQY